MIGVSSTLEHENGSGWLTVSGVKSVTFPGFNVTSIDTTNLGCTNYAMTFEPGMSDSGAGAFEVAFSEATYTQLTNLFRDVVGWRVTSPDGVVATCDGFLTKLDVTPTANDQLMISAEIKFTGLVVIS